MKIGRIESISHVAPIQRITMGKRVKRIEKTSNPVIKKAVELYDENMGKYVDITIGGPIFGKYTILRQK